MKKYVTESNGVKTEYEFVPSETLPADFPISTPLTFAFIGKSLVGTKNKGGQWEPLSGEPGDGETWTDGLKRETLEKAGLVIDHISVVGYIVARSSGDSTNFKFTPKNILPVTISFVQEVKKEWNTLGQEHFIRAWAPKTFIGRDDNGQLAEIFDYVMSYYDDQKYDYSFDYVEGDSPITDFPNTQSMTFVRTLNNKFLIVRDFNESFFSLPGGGCNMDEDGQVCAIREVREEAQVELKNIQLIGTIIVKVGKNGQSFSTSTQQRYLAEAVEVKNFIEGLDTFDSVNCEVVERKEVSLGDLGEEVKLLKNKTGEATLAHLERLLG